MSPIIIGHQNRWNSLARSYGLGRLPQTLLISGTAQVGKWTLAQHYARLLLCPHSLEAAASDADLAAPCGHCRVCRQVLAETYADFAVFRPLVSSVKDEKDWVIAPEGLEGSVLSVEVARKFGAEAMRKPMLGPRKVMVINQAERMTNEAQNALLKTFEEPVPGLTILLLTANPSYLLPTVLSRCWHLPLGLAGRDDLAEWLRQQFPDATDSLVEEAVKAGAGRPGAAWRELSRLKVASDVVAPPDGGRLMQATRLVRRADKALPVAALALTEEALRLARLWAVEDQALPGEGEVKKPSAKVTRSAVVHFLDELARAYRERWLDIIATAAAHAPAGTRSSVTPPAGAAAALDQIRKTRHYILCNANINLALDVMFGNLIHLQGAGRDARG